ncbi:hypothetical protein [Winogradskyella sp. PC D3.3]
MKTIITIIFTRPSILQAYSQDIKDSVVNFLKQLKIMEVPFSLNNNVFKTTYSALYPCTWHNDTLKHLSTPFLLQIQILKQS